MERVSSYNPAARMGLKITVRLQCDLVNGSCPLVGSGLPRPGVVFLFQVVRYHRGVISVKMWTWSI